MITLKKSELEPLLLTISTYDKTTQQLISGLLKENLTLGTKRKIQKIHKAAYAIFTELTENVKDIQKACEKEEKNDKGEPTYDLEKLNKEYKILMDEEIKLDVEQFQISQLDDISTTSNYNFEIIEKIAI